MGYNFQVNYNGSGQYKTYLGGIISIIISFLFIIGFGYFSRELIEKKNPFITPTIEQYEDFEEVEVSKDHFFTILGIQTSGYEYYIDDSIYELIGSFSGYVNDENNSAQWFSDNFTPVPCNTMYNSSDLIDTFPGYTYELEKMWCIPDIGKEKMKVRGFFGAKSLRNVVFQLNRCTNSTVNNNNRCKPNDVIDKMLQGGVIAIQSNKYVIDPKNLENPFKKFTVNIFSFFNLKMQINFEYRLRPLEFVTDYGFLLESNKLNRAFDYDDPKNMYVVTNEVNPKTLSKVAFQGLNNGTKYFRKYEKIQDVLTKIGGLLKAFLFIGQLITYSSLVTEFYTDIFSI